MQDPMTVIPMDKVDTKAVRGKFCSITFMSGPLGFHGIVKLAYLNNSMSWQRSTHAPPLRSK